MTFLLASLSSVLAMAAPTCERVAIGATSIKANRWHRDACGFDINLPAGTASASIVPAATPATELKKKKCELAVDSSGKFTMPAKGSNANCDALFADDVGGWLLLVDGAWSGIEWETPETSAYVLEDETSPFPAETSDEHTFYWRLGYQHEWTEGQGDDFERPDGRVVATAPLRTQLKHHAENDTGLEVLVHVPVGRSRFQLAKLKIERKAKGKSPGTPVKGPTNLRAACREEAGLPVEPAYDAAIAARTKAEAAELKGAANAADLAVKADELEEKARVPVDERSRAGRRKRRKLRAKATRKEDWGYVICVNAVDPNAWEAVIATTREGADPLAERTGTHLFSGRPVDVRVWADPRSKVKVELGGTAGVLSRVAEAPGAAKARGTASGKVTAAKFRKQFAGRSTEDDYVDLEIAQTIEISKDKTETLPEVVIPLRVEDAWVGAFRFAASATWAPWDRTWTTRTRNIGLNPGREVIIDEGAGSGLPHVEFVAGYSVFWRPVYEDERTVSVASFFGLGVLSTGEGEGLDVFSSVHVTPVELVVGRYFGIGPDVSVRRTERLKADLDVGSPVSEGQDITRFGITPTFGVVLNFSPRFVQTVGLARKGFGK